jgi:hypothetical protein
MRRVESHRILDDPITDGRLFHAPASGDETPARRAGILTPPP